MKLDALFQQTQSLPTIYLVPLIKSMRLLSLIQINPSVQLSN
jgi:hypothetical protein